MIKNRLWPKALLGLLVTTGSLIGGDCCMPQGQWGVSAELLYLKWCQENIQFVETTGNTSCSMPSNEHDFEPGFRLAAWWTPTDCESMGARLEYTYFSTDSTLSISNINFVTQAFPTTLNTPTDSTYKADSEWNQLDLFVAPFQVENCWGSLSLLAGLRYLKTTQDYEINFGGSVQSTHKTLKSLGLAFQAVLDSPIGCGWVLSPSLGASILCGHLDVSGKIFTPPTKTSFVEFDKSDRAIGSLEGALRIGRDWCIGGFLANFSVGIEAAYWIGASGVRSASFESFYVDANNEDLTLFGFNAAVGFLF